MKEDVKPIYMLDNKPRFWCYDKLMKWGGDDKEKRGKRKEGRGRGKRNEEGERGQRKEEGERGERKEKRGNRRRMERGFERKARGGGTLLG